MFRPTTAHLARPALVLLAAAAGATAAEAQFYGGYPPAYGYYNAPPPPEPYVDSRPYGQPRPLSPRAVVDRLDELGYEDIGRPIFSGTLYTVDATSPGGRRERVVVDAIRGAILNRTALGAPAFRGRDEDAFDEDRPIRRRYGGRPLDTETFDDDIPPRGRLAPDQDPRFEAPPRDAARPPDERVVPGRALPAPADPRLAPGERADRPFEGRSTGREAARTEPAPARPYGTNPEGEKPARKKPAEQQARRPQNPAAEESRKPPVSPTPGAPPPKADAPAGKATADADKPRPNRPVRVIEGVTPMGTPPASGAAQLDRLPEPPAVPAPGTD